MAETFGAGFSNSMGGLLNALNADRDRKAQEAFRLKLIEDENRSSKEIAERVRKQRALEVFGRGLTEIQNTKINNALGVISQKNSKSLKRSGGTLEQLQKEYDKTRNEFDRISERLVFNEARANATPKRGLDSLLEQDPAVVGQVPKQEDPNAGVNDLLKAKGQRLADLENAIQGYKSQFDVVQNSLLDKEQKVRGGYTIDDALTSREAQILARSLGLTDDDISTFKTGDVETKGDSLLMQLMQEPEISFTAPTLGEAPQLLSSKDIAPSKVDESLVINPVKKAQLRSKLEKVDASKDLTSLSSLSEEEFDAVLNDPELNPLLRNKMLGLGQEVSRIKQAGLGGGLTSKDFAQLARLTKVGAELKEDEFKSITQGKPKTGRANIFTLASELGTDDFMGSVYKKRDTEKSNLVNDVFNADLRRRFSKFGPMNRDVRQEKVEQNFDKKGKALDDLTFNLDALRKRFTVPDYQYKYRPIDFSFDEN